MIVSILVSLLAAQLVIQLPFFDAIGPFSAGLLGVVMCFTLAYGFLYFLDPDPISEFDVQVPLYLRTLPITGLSAFIWLPVYVTIFNRLRRQRSTA